CVINWHGWGWCWLHGLRFTAKILNSWFNHVFSYERKIKPNETTINLNSNE
ncbi:3291_t:CDS:1, partial [Gigaspora rosea]